MTGSEYTLHEALAHMVHCATMATYSSTYTQASKPTAVVGTRSTRVAGHRRSQTHLRWDWRGGRSASGFRSAAALSLLACLHVHWYSLFLNMGWTYLFKGETKDCMAIVAIN